MKTQDTIAALERLRAAGVTNERFALRRFPEIHGVTVMMPANLSAPGEVSVFSTPRHGIFDIGRYPHGHNHYDDALAQALEAANIGAFVTPEVMQSKHGKLIPNLNNILEAALGLDADCKRFDALLRAGHGQGLSAGLPPAQLYPGGAQGYSGGYQPVGPDPGLGGHGLDSDLHS